jgi:hypothetical protein
MNSGITAALTGPKKPEHIEESAAAGRSLSPEERGRQTRCSHDAVVTASLAFRRSGSWQTLFRMGEALQRANVPTLP